MKIVFHGANAANFRGGIEGDLDAPHEILCLSDKLDASGEREHYQTADVIVGIRLSAAEPIPQKARLYHAPAAGTDAIERHRLAKGAVLCNCFGHEDAIAEYVMMALLMQHVPINRADARLREGYWDYWAGSPNALRTELGSQTLGLLGYGHIGKAIGRRAKAFGMKIIVCNRTAVPADNKVDAFIPLDNMLEFMGQVDAVVVSLPLIDATRGIIGKTELAEMRPHARVVNVGRGPVIDEQALFDVLSKNRIGGAVIDTWYQYPSGDRSIVQPSQYPFHTLHNVTMTPHMSGWTEGTVTRRRQSIARNINNLAAGKILENMI